jgi:acetyl esterase/lipase
MKLSLTIIALLLAGTTRAQQTFDLWPGVAPGSESWTWSEQLDSSRPGDPLAYNIAKPTLTYYPVKGAKTCVIICPGGSFCYLHVETEGRSVAQWLNKRGIAAFVLKYRVIHSLTNDPMKEKTTHSKEDAAALAPLAMADVRKAITFVRTSASKLNLDTSRIGIMGFSAGGALAVVSAFGYDAGNRPDFVAPIYPYIPPTMDLKTSADAPPLFIAAATDDDYHLVPMSIRLYNAYLETGHNAELHIYSKGGHGFGMNVQHQPSDTWIDRFGDWLQLEGY